MDPESKKKKAFSTQNDHFEFLRMSFELENGPATFQRFMNTILGELIGQSCLVYLNDIIVFSTSLQEHIESLDRVLKKL